MRPVIRLARDGDTDNIASLVARYWEFESIEGFDRSRISTLLDDFNRHPERGRCWVAEEGGQLIGYLLAVFLFSLEYGGMMAEIDEFFVLAEKRSLHIGNALFDAAHRTMAQEGITHLQLQLGRRNFDARRFYERRGFKRRGGYDVLHKPI